MASPKSLCELPNPLNKALKRPLHSIKPLFCLLTITTRKQSTVSLRELDAEKGTRERVVVLGSGWAGQI